MSSQSPYVAPQQPKKKRKIPIWAWVVGVVVVIAIVAGAASAGGKKKKSDDASTAPAAVAPSAAAASPAVVAPKPTTAPKPTPSSLLHGEDVAITSCTADPTTGYLSAAVTVTNNSSKTSNYAITIAFESKDGSQQLDTGLVAVNDLNAGQVSQQTALGLTAAPAAGYDCKVADLTRYAS